MRECRGVVDVPAVGVLCGLWVDEDEAEGFGGCGKFGARVPLRGGAAAGVELWLLLEVKSVFLRRERRTATMMAGLVATLAGTDTNIWRLVGLVPKPVTCWSAPNAEPADANTAVAVVKAFIVVIVNL